MATSGEQVLPVVRVAELPSEELAERWLVEQLWCAQSVGVMSDSVSEGATISVQWEPPDRLRRESFEGARKEG